MLHRLERYEEAITAYDQALALWPPDPSRVDPALTWARKALALMQLRRYEEVVAACDRALSFETGDAVVQDTRGVALMRLQRYEEAIASLERAVAAAPRYASAWKDLAAALRAAGRETDANDVERRTKDLPDDDTAPMIEIRF